MLIMNERFVVDEFLASDLASQRDTAFSTRQLQHDAVLQQWTVPEAPT